MSSYLVYRTLNILFSVVKVHDEHQLIDYVVSQKYIKILKNTMDLSFYINDVQWHFGFVLENKPHVKTILKALPSRYSWCWLC